MKKLLLLLVVQMFAFAAIAQQVGISGKVTDATTSEPVAGATVMQVGTATGAITGADGTFSFNVPSGASIIVEMVGYKSVTEVVGNRTVINVPLEVDAQLIEETVVIGYGQSRKSDLSAAIATKDIGENVKSRPAGVISALQGQIAGVSISNNGGDPLGNRSGQSVSIRGQGSRGGDAVLYVVDGVPGAPFNQEDVTNISILKDAASAAIYGANVGSGGVILVTTKRATVGKVQVNAKASYGIANPVKVMNMLDAEGYVKVVTDASRVSNSPLPNGVNPTLYPFGQVTHTDWMDEIFRTGSTQRYSVSLSGGSETVNSYASAEYSKTQGTILNTWNENFGGRVNVNFKVAEWLRINQKLNFTYGNGQGDLNTTTHTGITQSAMFMPPSATVYEVDQNNNVLYDVAGNPKFAGTVPLWAVDKGVNTFGDVRNPVAMLNRLQQYRPSTETFSTTSIILDPFKHFNFRSDISAKVRNERYQDFSYRVPEVGKPTTDNSREIQSRQTFSWLWENIATYDRTFGRHSMNLMAGYTMGYGNSRWVKTVVNNFPDEDIYSQHFINGTDWSKNKPEEEFWEDSSVSVMARGAYSFDDRYFATASVRRDATSKLYSGNNSGVFPAFSGAWKISSEKFMKTQKVISFLKLRASWGQVGNVGGVRRYSYLSNFESNGEFAYLGANRESKFRGVGLTTYPNPELRWETSEQTDIGLDINFLKNRLTFAFDYFIKDTKDLIEEIPVASTAGISTAPLGNIGKVRNSGYELTVGWNDQTKSGLSYNINGNVSYIKNEVLDLGTREYFHHDENIRDGVWTMRSQVGNPWYSYYLIKTAGIFQNQAEIDAHVTTKGKAIQPNAQPGDLRFIDQNNDGLINDSDRVYNPSYVPKVTFGLSASFEYKGFDLSVVLQGVAGNKIFNGAKQLSYNPGQGWNMSADLLNSWGYNKNSDIPLVSQADKNANLSTASDFYLENGSYARLKNLTFGYTLPKKIFGNASTAPRIRVYFSGENLATITHYTGMDPECGNLGMDGGIYPISRIFSFGVNLSF